MDGDWPGRAGGGGGGAGRLHQAAARPGGQVGAGGPRAGICLASPSGFPSPQIFGLSVRRKAYLGDPQAPEGHGVSTSPGARARPVGRVPGLLGLQAAAGDAKQSWQGVGCLRSSSCDSRESAGCPEPVRQAWQPQRISQGCSSKASPSGSRACGSKKRGWGSKAEAQAQATVARGPGPPAAGPRGQVREASSLRMPIKVSSE